MSKDHPILFSTPMVQAILERRKTQTRRIIKPQPIIDQDSGFVFDGKHRKQYDIHCWMNQFIDDFSRWMPGDLLWVRETWGWVPTGKGEKIGYKATHSEPMHNKWKPSIHMYKECARIWLEVTDINVERLHEISEVDAIAEGVKSTVKLTDDRMDYTGYYAVEHFQDLWTKINGEESWKANPWVWVLIFKILSTTGKP